MSDNPLVSIITPVYNGARYLEATIQSVLAQDYPHVEHIVIDDGSTDGGATVAILARYPHLRWWSRENRGQYATMNEGLGAAKGELVLFLSADDLLAPSAVRRALEYLAAHPGCDAVYGRWEHIDESGEPLPVQSQITGRWPRWAFKYLSFVSHCALFVRRDLLVRRRLFFDATLRYTGDADWIDRLLYCGARIDFVDAVLARYRFHSNQTIRTAAVRAIREEKQRFFAGRHGSYRLHRLLWDAMRWRSRLLRGMYAVRTEGPVGAARRVADWRRRRAAHTDGDAPPPTAVPGSTKLPARARDLLCCSMCRAPLVDADGLLRCTGQGCGAHFPVVDGIPVLINDETSAFRVQDFVERRQTFFSARPALNRRPSALLPDIGRTIGTRARYARFLDLLCASKQRPLVLVLGGSIAGQGSQDLLHHPGIDRVESDVAFGPRTMLVCDAHDIPFGDCSFDGVVAQAVLEHVADPYRCVQEIHRVLKDGGLVYAETPFMQQVHGGRYDFTRFTHLGHRRLFRRFEEIEGGAGGGPGAALAWAYLYFLTSFAEGRGARRLLKALARLTSFWLKYRDPQLIDKRGTLDAAWGYYFLGCKSDRTLSDRELVMLYRGLP